MTQPSIFDAPARTVPDYKRDPFGWNIHYLEQNTHLYREFRRRADLHVAEGKTVRANRIIQELRFETDMRGSDAFKINDHASGLFARLYQHEHPRADVEVQRKGHWKDISPETWGRILAAFAALRRRGLV
jgi:hypothetical protein